MPRSLLHLCHAQGCKTAVPPKLLMCRDHWYMIPMDMRDRVWVLYRPGQEVTKDPSDEYVKHVMACIDYVAVKEGRRG